MAARNRPYASFGVEGTASTRPVTFRNQLSTVCECCAPKPSEAPFARRIVTGTSTWPPVMYRYLANWLAI